MGTSSRQRTKAVPIQNNSKGQLVSCKGGSISKMEMKHLNLRHTIGSVECSDLVEKVQRETFNYYMDKTLEDLSISHRNDEVEGSFKGFSLFEIVRVTQLSCYGKLRNLEVVKKLEKKYKMSGVGTTGNELVCKRRKTKDNTSWKLIKRKTEDVGAVSGNMPMVGTMSKRPKYQGQEKESSFHNDKLLTDKNLLPNGQLSMNPFIPHQVHKKLSDDMVNCGGDKTHEEDKSSENYFPGRRIKQLMRLKRFDEVLELHKRKTLEEEQATEAEESVPGWISSNKPPSAGVIAVTECKNASSSIYKNRPKYQTPSFQTSYSSKIVLNLEGNNRDEKSLSHKVVTSKQIPGLIPIPSYHHEDQSETEQRNISCILLPSKRLSSLHKSIPSHPRAPSTTNRIADSSRRPRPLLPRLQSDRKSGHPTATAYHQDKTVTNISNGLFQTGPVHEVPTSPILHTDNVDNLETTPKDISSDKYHGPVLSYPSSSSKNENTLLSNASRLSSEYENKRLMTPPQNLACNSNPPKTKKTVLLRAREGVFYVFADKIESLQTQPILHLGEGTADNPVILDEDS